MSKSFVRLFLCSASLMLSACGDGWEAQRTTEHFPYGGQRTAGSGVIYVKAKMLPEKELKTEPVLQPQAAPAPALDGDKIFSEAQTKGYTPPPPVKEETKSEAPTTPPPTATDPVAKPADDKGADATPVLTPPPTQEQSKQAAAGAIGSKPVDVVPPPPAAAETAAKADQSKNIKSAKEATKEISTPITANASSAKEATSAPAAIKSEAAKSEAAKTTTEATAHKPQTLTTHSLGSTAQRHPQEAEVGVTTLQPGAGVTPVDNSNERYEVYQNTVIQPTHSISMPDNEIVSPKKEIVKRTTDGQKSLQQIYDDAF